MVASGKVVLFEFPRTNQPGGKLRPALVLKEIPGSYADVLLCMISTQLHQEIENYDEVISPANDDFEKSGLKAKSLFRIFRVAVVEKETLEGIIGEVSDQRINRIRTKLSDWLNSSPQK